MKITNRLLVAAILLALSAPARAGFITAPTSVLNAPTPIGAFSFDRTIDQSGLSAGYISGVTDFATYIASSPVHIGSNSPANYAATLGSPRIVDYDLGTSLEIQQLAFWQYPHASAGPIIDFQVFTSNDAGFASAILVGSFTALVDGTGLGLPGTSAQVFDLVDTNAQYLRIDVLTVDPASTGFGWSEIALDTVPFNVPEPASLALLGIGLAGLGFARKKKAH